MELDQWAPGAWQFLHAVTFAYPDEPSFQQTSTSKAQNKHQQKDK